MQAVVGQLVFQALPIPRRALLTVIDIVGYCAAIYLWWPMLLFSPLLLYAVPFFHSLQYLAFVYKMKKKEFEQMREAGEKPLVPLLLFLAIGLTLGDLFMHAIPTGMDNFYSPLTEGFSKNYFILSFLLFINIHHYFLDNTYWRRDNATVQKLLFKG